MSAKPRTFRPLRLDECLLAARHLIELSLDQLAAKESAQCAASSAVDSEMSSAMGVYWCLKDLVRRRDRFKPGAVAKMADLASQLADHLRKVMSALAEQVQDLEAVGESTCSHLAAGAYGLLELAEQELAALRMEVSA